MQLDHVQLSLEELVLMPVFLSLTHTVKGHSLDGPGESCTIIFCRSSPLNVSETSITATGDMVAVTEEAE